MRTRYCCLLLVASLAVSPTVASALAPQAEAPTTAFVNVTVLPMTGSGPLPNHTVVVRDGRIATVGPTAEISTLDVEREPGDDRASPPPGGSRTRGRRGSS